MPRTDMVTLKPEAIDARRVELGMTLPEFAKQTTLSEMTLRTARAGKSISLASARDISRALRCPLSKLLSSATPKFNIEPPIPATARAAV